MKKSKQYRTKKAVARNAHRSMKTTKRANNPVIGYVIKGKRKIKIFKARHPERIPIYEHGPSLVITTDKDGKLNYNSWSKKNYFHHTKMSMDITNSYHEGVYSKKDKIKSILMKAGYDPTIQYTRKEKKKFTRIVKDNLFVKPVAKPFDKDEAKAKAKLDNKIRKEKRAKGFENIPLSRNSLMMRKNLNDFFKVLANKQKRGDSGIQPSYTAEEMATITYSKEKPNKRTFTYEIHRKTEANPDKSYCFKTDFFEASTKKEAEEILKEKYKDWEKDTSFSGMMLKDRENDNMSKYYSPLFFKQAA